LESAQWADPTDVLEVAILVKEDSVLFQNELSDVAIHRATDRQTLASTVEENSCGFSVCRQIVASKEELLTSKILV
jgi:hypothetical protein